MKKFIITAVAVAPVFAFAQGAPTLGNLHTLLTSIGNLIQTALPIVVGLALLAFFWGLVKFIFAQSSEEKKADAKKIMIWSVVALFVMVSVWGLVRFIGNALGVGEGGSANVPTVPGL